MRIPFPRLPPVRLTPLLLAAVTAACAVAFPASTGTDTVGPGYVTGGGTWNTGGGISAVARVYGRDGATVVCGAWATDRQSGQSYLLNEQVMQAASAFLAGERLVHGLSFMARVPWAENIAGAQANCVASPVAWQPGFSEAEPVLRFPRMAFPEDGEPEEGAFGGRNNTIFRQTPRAEIVR